MKSGPSRHFQRRCKFSISVKTNCTIFLSQEGFRLAQPVFLGFVTRYFSPLSHDITTSNAYLYGLGLALSALFTSLNIIPLNFVRQRLGMRARIAASALVYRKVCGYFIHPDISFFSNQVSLSNKSPPPKSTF